jgi:hypothetical protein
MVRTSFKNERSQNPKEGFEHKLEGKHRMGRRRLRCEQQVRKNATWKEGRMWEVTEGKE